MSVSAVILSKRPVSRLIPGVTVVPFVSEFSCARGLLQARLESIKRVQTDSFFFLDDDDELPADYLRVLELCEAVDTPLAYTDELITGQRLTPFVRRSAPYSEDAFIEDPTLIHHLAVCKTDAALRASAVVPRGLFMFENLLWFQVAKEGATYVPEVGYIWNRSATGLSRDPSILTSLVQSSTWAYRHREEAT